MTSDSTAKMQTEVACPGCGLELPDSPGVYDGYYHTSVQCWALYTEVLGEEFQNAVLFGQVHQLTVDAYALQHAGGRHPDKSIDVHLVGLHCQLEQDVPSPQVPAYLQRLAASVEQWPHFEPPIERGPLTVFDVAMASSPTEHAERVRAWARQLWSAWAPHHDAVAQFAQRALPR